jgi:tRNA dimethylallyltransferase
MNKLITILGPTASGKSSLGIELAKDFTRRGGGAEIVSADSRQVFRGLDIGSGKVTKDKQAQVKHHLLDIIDPMEEFSVSHFQKLAFEAIDDIHSRGKTPFLVGGTALYIYSVIDNYIFSDVPPNPKRRKELEKKTVKDLNVILSEVMSCTRRRTKSKDLRELRSNVNDEDPSTPRLDSSTRERSAQDDASFYGLSPDDLNNPRRLIRAIEKLEAGVPVEPQKGAQKYDNVILGIDVPRDELYKKIDQRVDERIKEGMIEEVDRLRRDGVKDEWLIRLGLEYRWITEFLQGKWSRDEMIKRLKGAIHAFARRQMTWFNRDKRIVWLRDQKQAQSQIKNFLN